MKLKFLIFFLALHISDGTLAQQKDLLSGKFSIEELKQIIVKRADWKPFPAIDDRNGWAQADQNMLKAYIGKGEAFLDYEWPSIPATKSLVFERTGDREAYQAISHKKREVLGALILAEIAENKGRFVDQAINGVWSICEESFWGVSAHIPQTKENKGLVDVTAPFVDLFAAETATYLAWADYFLGDKFDAVSPQVRKRIYIETNNRIFQPVMKNHHWWMGVREDGTRPNNWNPWICSNWLSAALLLERDEDKRTAMVHKILDVLDEFLNPYPQDGGCDEGPSYWGRAAGSLYDNIALLNLATNDSFRYVFTDEKFKNMGKFIYRAQISPSYFLNFADADPQPSMSSKMIYRFGKDIQDEDMMKFGAFYREPETGSIGRTSYFRNFFHVFNQEEYRNAVQGMPLPKDVWLSDTQVMIARDQAGSTKGFFLAAKGGHNAESHNHNDVGNYVVYYDGHPLVMDVGRGTYTRRTFNAERYDIWFNRSDFHNVPSVNGKTQMPGLRFEAKNVSYTERKASSQLSLDISKAYSDEAGISSLKRTIRLNRGKNIILQDEIKLTSAASYVQHVMTCYPVTVEKNGDVIIHYKTPEGTSKDFTIQYKSNKLKATVEKVKLEAMEDAGVKEKWGDSVYRINFTTHSPTNSETFSFQITPR